MSPYLHDPPSAYDLQMYKRAQLQGVLMCTKLSLPKQDFSTRSENFGSEEGSEELTDGTGASEALLQNQLTLRL